MSVTAGTIFDWSKLSLVVIFRALWTWLHKFRRLMVFPGRGKLSGIVEIDETLVGGNRAGKRGRGAEGKSLVVIAIEILEKGTGRVRMSLIPDASKKSLGKFITENIITESVLLTDGWKGFDGISNKGYKRVIQDNTKVLDGEEILPNVHIPIPGNILFMSSLYMG